MRRNRIHVASGTAALGEAVEPAVEGVYDLKKVASQAWAAGDKIYWDNTAKNTTKTLTANTLIGVAENEAVAGGATDLIGRVRLNGAGLMPAFAAAVGALLR